MKPITFTICFDLNRTNPNRIRGTWRNKSSRYNAAKTAARAWLLSQNVTDLPESCNISLLVRRGRAMDDDNIIAAFKPLRDEIWPKDGQVRIVDVKQEIGPQWKDREEIVVTVVERRVR